MRAASRRRGGVGLWAAFVLVHGWLTLLGVVVVPAAAFHDVDLYRYWMYLALEQGQWPVLDQPWVYPVGALVPMLLPALTGTVSTVGYALSWSAMVTLLDAVALWLLIRPGRPGAPSTSGAWWWLTFLTLLGPVAIGRLDAVIAPLMVVALTLTVRDARATRAVAALLTAGAWIKVAPGALLLPIAAAARRPVRSVAMPAAVVCGVVVAVVAAAGGAGRLLGFLTEQRGRGLQVESVTATPWMLASVVRDDVTIALNEALITYEVAGPGTGPTAAVLDVVLVLMVVAVAAALRHARRNETADAALLPASLTLLLVLIVANKVGSPQFLAWPAAPLAVMLTHRHPDGTSTATPPTGGTRGLRVAGALALVAAGLTQVVFPWGYLGLLTGDVLVSSALAVRNLILVALLASAAAGLLQAVRGGARAGAQVAVG